jgi:2-keto-4-pentenoate hydratase/2-oxohepta-3-ene-1,7-dioic acid hydratase in catechol pathway
VELGVVFGRRGFRVAPDRAMEHVFGYTIFHDVSARYVQFKDNNEQMGKNFATFAPMGPCIVTKDEIPDPTKCRLSLKVNGQVKQDFDNRDWCFPLHRMIEWVSMGLPLEPGDVMTTGTGKGVGAFAQPPCFLKPGDVCELEITGIGKLVNPVKSDPYVFRTQPNS